MGTLAPYAKAVTSFVATVAGALLLVIGDDPTATLADLTTVQWLGVIVLVLGPAGVYAVPNAEDG